MALLKEQLELAGYDTSGLDEADLLSRLDQAGFDTSSLGGGQTPSQPQAAQPELKPEESRGRRFARKVANVLPATLGIGVPATAALVSGGTSLPATAALSGVSAAAGEGLKQAILSSLGDQAPTLAETTGKVAKTGLIDAALTYTGGKLLGGVAKGAKLAKDLVVKPGAAEVAQAGKEALVEIGEKGAEKLALARATREAAKKGLIEAEEKAGLHFEATPGFEAFIKDPKKMAEFSQKIGRLAKQTPEELAQSIPSEQLQLFRKIAQEGEKVSGLSDIANSQLRQGKDVFTQALGLKEKGVGSALGRFREADKVVSEIPGELKAKLARSKLQGSKDVLEARKLDKKRKVVKGLAAAAAGYLGLKSLIK